MYCADGLRKTRNTRYSMIWVWVKIGADKLQNGSLMLNVLLSYLHTYSIEHSPSWEANWFWANQAITRIFGSQRSSTNSHVPATFPILSQLHPVPTSPTTSWGSILILSSYLRLSPEWSLSLIFPHQNLVHPSPFPHTFHMPLSSYSSRRLNIYITEILLCVLTGFIWLCAGSTGELWYTQPKADNLRGKRNCFVFWVDEKVTFSKEYSCAWCYVTFFSGIGESKVTAIPVSACTVCEGSSRLGPPHYKKFDTWI